MFFSLPCWFLVFTWSGINSARKGFFSGAVLLFLIAAAMDCSYHAFMNLHDPILYVVDAAVFTFLGGLMGGAAGWILGSGKVS